MKEPRTVAPIPPLVEAMPGAAAADCYVCGLDTYYRVQIGDGCAPVCSEECRRAFPRVHATRDLLAKHQWASEVRVDYDDTLSCCPECSGIPPELAKTLDGRTDGNPVGHADDCALALAIGAPTRSALDD